MRTLAMILGLFMLPVFVQAEDETRLLSGRVVDAEGNPVEGVDVATFWNANGITKEELVKRQESPDEQIHWQPEGVMEPWGIEPVKTDAHGQFSVAARDADYKLMALDAQRQRGGIGLIDPQHPEEPLKIVLQPLIRVLGKIRIDKQPTQPGWTAAVISLPLNKHFPLGRDRLAFCGSDRCKFEFLLPPGRYVLHANNDSSEDNTLNAETFPNIVINLNEDQAEIDVGEVVLQVMPRLPELVDESKAKGTWTDLAQRYGQPAPDWHVHDAKGASKDAQPRDFRGKWLVIYFWGPYCTPCLKQGLPELIDFYEQHHDQRHSFEAIAFCLDKDGSMQSIGDIDRLLKPVVENVWDGKSVSFPILLENSFETFERYGLSSVGHIVLVNPEGKLFKGDLTTIAEILTKKE